MKKIKTSKYTETLSWRGRDVWTIWEELKEGKEYDENIENFLD